jgi:hypothetical protein
MRQRFFAILAIAVVVQACNPSQQKDCKEWVAKIDDDVICKAEVEKQYDLFLDNVAKMQRMDKKDLLSRINNDSEVKKNPMLLQFRKQNFVDNYIDEYIVYKEAKKQGYHKKDDVQTMLKRQRRNIISQAYLQDNMDNEKPVTDKQVEEYYKEYRKKDPRIARLPIQKAMKQIRYMLTKRKQQMQLKKMMQEIRDKYKINQNKKVSFGQKSSADIDQGQEKSAKDKAQE